MASPVPKDAMEFPPSDRVFLEPHLPPRDCSTRHSNLPFTTLTFATSLDSSLTLSPGAPTAISGPQSKAMTHYLRSRHDGILIGVGTAVADDPSLDCRIAGRPVVIDPTARWEFIDNSKRFKLYREGCGRLPWIVTALREPPAEKRVPPEKYGGKCIIVEIAASDIGEHHLDWNLLLVKLKENGLNSVMVEGGGQVISSLLSPQYRPNIDIVIVTMAPAWLGQGGVVVSPKRCFNDAGIAIPAARLIIPFS